MDGLLISSNEKFKSLHGELERYKKSVTEEMRRITKEMMDTTGNQMVQITKTHSNMKKQIEGLLDSLAKAQLDTKGISSRIKDIEDELERKTSSLMNEIKVTRFIELFLFRILFSMGKTGEWRLVSPTLFILESNTRQQHIWSFEGPES